MARRKTKKEKIKTSLRQKSVAKVVTEGQENQVGVDLSRTMVATVIVLTILAIIYRF